VMGGRIDDFAVVESNPDIIYVGSASGGVFKTTNGGTTWTALFDDQPSSSIGDITLAPSDPSIVWVGTGEANNRQSSSWGNGVYKSTDGGATWQHMGLDGTMHIGRIAISPADPNTVYVAALGSLWGPSKDRGVYKTTDGGKTWNKVLFVNDDTGVSDIAMDPQSPGTLIAAAYQRRRTVYGYDGSGPGSGLYKTTDGGATWKKLETGLPWDPDRDKADDDAQTVNEIGRIGVDFYRKDPNIVYAVVEHAHGGVFRSDDAGETWTKMSDTDPRGSYYSQIRVDPNNDQRLWVAGAQMFVSEDGGKTFVRNYVQRIHGDFHAIWIDPNDSNMMLAGSDGGIHLSRDRGRTWDFLNVIPLAQFYEIGLDNENPYRICGGLQDNNVWCGPSATMEFRGISAADWYTVGGGDGFYAQFDPNDPGIVYAESQDGNVLRRNLGTHEARSIRPPAPEGERYRFQWNSPIVVSTHAKNTIYYGGNYLFKSTDRGDTWTRLGPDLTNGQDRNTLPIMGRVPDKYTLSRDDGVEHWPAITTVSESPLNADVLYVGTDDGNLQVTRDAGKTWKNVAERVRGVPKGTYVSRVVASKYNEGTAYATFDGHRSDDRTMYVYVTSDYGESWKPIRNGLPDGDIAHVIREHFRDPNLLFLGTEHGLYVSPDRGAHWTRLKLNLPTVPVDDIEIQARENDLVLGTHGRSIWILDDITPLEQWSDAINSENLHLFDIRPATEWRLANRGGNTGHQVFFGENPPNGAAITYFLKSKPAKDEKVKITITDKNGKVVREMDGDDDPGVNRVVWDLRTKPVDESPSPFAPPPETRTRGARRRAPAGGGGGFFRFTGALRVEPGVYTVKLAEGPTEQTKSVTVVEDPRVQFSDADRAARAQALEQLSHMAAMSVAARRSITGLRTSVDKYVEGVKKEKDSKTPENVRKAAEDLLARADALCPKFGTEVQCGERGEGLGFAGPPLVYTPPSITQRVMQLMGQIENFSAPPTQWQLDEMKLLQGMLRDEGPAVRKLAQEDLAALNKMMNDAGLPHITVVRTRERGEPPTD